MRSRVVTIATRAVAIVCVLGAVFAAAPADARSAREFRMRDDCDAASFNAVLGAGACIGNGGTTIDEFNAELAQRGSVGAWKYDPDHTEVRAGDQVVVVNRGGETHTFTKVAAFGGGFVAALNQASGNPVPATECASVNPDGSLAPRPPSPTNMFVSGHTQAPVNSVSAGTTFYQCCIHPWMRIRVTRQ